MPGAASVRPGGRGRFCGPPVRGRRRHSRGSGAAPGELVEQGPDRGEARAGERVVALATVVLDGGQPCLGEQSQMFAHRGPADRVPCREVDHSGRAGGKCAQQITAYGVGQGDERVHPLFVTHRLPIGKSSTPRLRDSPNEEATSRRGHFLTRPSVIATMSATRPPTRAARAPATSQANTGRPPNAKDLSRQVGGTRATAR